MVVLVSYEKYLEVKTIDCVCFPEFCLRDRTRSAAQASLFQPSPSSSLTLIKEGQQGDRWWKMFPGSFKLIWFRNHFKGCGQEHSSWFYICGAAFVRSLLFMFSTLSWVVWWMLNLAAWFSHVSLLQKRHNFTFFFFPGYHRKNILPGTKYSIQNREPDTANNLELVVQELQREFPSILTNEWEPHSFDSSVGYMWFYSTTFQLYVDFSFFTSVFFMWNKNPSMNLWDMQERLNLLLQLHSAGSVLHTLFGFS